MHVFICENTPNGILTGVYDAWELKIQERCSDLIGQDIAAVIGAMKFFFILTDIQ